MARIALASSVTLLTSQLAACSMSSSKEASITEPRSRNLDHRTPIMGPTGMNLVATASTSAAPRATRPRASARGCRRDRKAADRDSCFAIRGHVRVAHDRTSAEDERGLRAHHGLRRIAQSAGCFAFISVVDGRVRPTRALQRRPATEAHTRHRQSHRHRAAGSRR
jgi:hypothetical protein